MGALRGGTDEGEVEDTVLSAAPRRRPEDQKPLHCWEGARVPDLLLPSCVPLDKLLNPSKSTFLTLSNTKGMPRQSPYQG